MVLNQPEMSRYVIVSTGVPVGSFLKRNVAFQYAYDLETLRGLKCSVLSPGEIDADSKVKQGSPC